MFPHSDASWLRRAALSNFLGADAPVSGEALSAWLLFN